MLEMSSSATDYELLLPSQQVFHKASKFSALLADEDPSEQDTEEQSDEKSET